MSVRVALGATRWRIVRQLLVESVLLAFIAGGLGLLLSIVGHPLVRRRGAERRHAVLDGLHDGLAHVRASCCVVCLATGVIFGLAPALHVSKTNVHEMLKEGGRTGSGGVRARRWTGRADRRPARADARAAGRRRLHDAQLPDDVPDGHRHRDVAAAHDAA